MVIGGIRILGWGSGSWGAGEWGLGVKVSGFGFGANCVGPRGVMLSQYGDGNEYDLCRGVSHERGILVARWGCGVKG